MLTPVTALDLRNALGTYLDRARLARESFVVTRNGRRIAVLIGAKDYDDLLRELEELSAKNLPVIEQPLEDAVNKPPTET